MLPPFYYKGVSDEGLYRNLRRDHRARRRRAAAHLPVPHPAGVAGADQPGADRAPAQGLSEHDRRHQGLLGRLEQHQGDARALRAAGLRRVRRQRDVPARRPARRRRGCISATANVNPAAIARALRASGRAPTPTRSRRRSTAIRGDLPEISDDPGAEARDRALERRSGLGARCGRRWWSSRRRRPRR